MVSEKDSECLLAHFELSLLSSRSSIHGVVIEEVVVAKIKWEVSVALRGFETAEVVAALTASQQK